MIRLLRFLAPVALGFATGELLKAGGCIPEASGAVPPCGLHGRVRFVASRAQADHVIRWVDGPADIRVRLVDRTPAVPGEWRPVTGMADFTIYETEGLADFTARAVTIDPGCP